MTFVDDGGREKFFAALQSAFRAHPPRRRIDDNIFYPSFCRRVRGYATRRCEIRRIIYAYTRGCDSCEDMSRERQVRISQNTENARSVCLVSCIVAIVSPTTKKRLFAESAAKKCIDYLSESRDHVP
ncbi:hypothetical protein CAJAP_06673 [Camponotus japonicus]